MRYSTPLRYPGGKAGLTGFLGEVIELNGLDGCAYYEPYAGGAGAALGLLRAGLVAELYLNDADKRIHAFWRAVLHSCDRFVERIRTVPLTIDEWRRQHDVCTHPDMHDEFDVGFAAFYMNRCNRSGVLIRSGPIGGYTQAGKWRMDVRFNRDALSERVLAVSREKHRIQVTGGDALEFLKRRLPRGQGCGQVFVYLDPPYVINGRRLYLNTYTPANHVELADYLDSQNALPWVASYDDCGLVRGLYAKHRMTLMPLRYSLQEKRAAVELIIAPHRLSMPSSIRRSRGRELVLEVAQQRRSGP